MTTFSLHKFKWSYPRFGKSLLVNPRFGARWSSPAYSYLRFRCVLCVRPSILEKHVTPFENTLLTRKCQATFHSRFVLLFPRNFDTKHAPYLYAPKTIINQKKCTRFKMAANKEQIFV